MDTKSIRSGPNNNHNRLHGVLSVIKEESTDSSLMDLKKNE